MTLSLDRFNRGMARLAVAFDVKADEAKAGIYWEELRDLADAAFDAAVRRALREWDKPFALPTIGFLRERADDAAGIPSPDEAAGRLRRKIAYRYAELTRPDADLDPAELALVRDLGMTPARLAAMPPKELDAWLTWTYRPAVERRHRGEAGDALLGVGHRPALGEGGDR